MNNLCLITSVINTPNTQLSYSNVRSIFTMEERFAQTKQTIQTIKEKIPNVKIFIIECSVLSDDIETYLIHNSDYYLNLYSNQSLRESIYGKSKSLGEGTMTIEALDYILNLKIEFDNLFKISGRYFLSNNFDYSLFCNTNNIFKKIDGDINNIFTALYKINFETLIILNDFLKNNISNMKMCIGYENIFANFLKYINYKNTIFINYYIGLEGYVTICGTKYNG